MRTSYQRLRWPVEAVVSCQHCRQYMMEYHFFLIIGFPQSSNEQKTLIAHYFPDQMAFRIGLGIEPLTLQTLVKTGNNWPCDQVWKKYPSQGLVTLLHICEVIRTVQSPISSETQRWASVWPRWAPVSPCWAPISTNRAPTSSHLPASVQVFHDVSQCYMGVSWCFTSRSWCFTSHSWCFTLCFTMFYVSRCLAMFYDV